MKRKFTTALSLAVVAGCIGVSFAQSAKADTTVMYGSTFLTPDTVLVESPTTFERVITSPVMIESPTTVERVISTPVIIEKKERRHLLEFGLFGKNLKL